jgi:hypothetical protein
LQIGSDNAYIISGSPKFRVQLNPLRSFKMWCIIDTLRCGDYVMYHQISEVPGGCHYHRAAVSVLNYEFITALFSFVSCLHSFQTLEFSISVFAVQTVVAVVCNWKAVVAIVFRCKCITLKSVFLLRTYWFVMTSDLR